MFSAKYNGQSYVVNPLFLIATRGLTDTSRKTVHLYGIKRVTIQLDRLLQLSYYLKFEPC